VPERPTSGNGPLAGVRAFVLTHAWMGTFSTELLALMGADVIQIESRQRPDSWRTHTYAARVPEVFRDRPEAKHAENTNALYNSVNLNKRSLTLNLQDARGLALYKRLIPFTDLVVENFTSRVLGNLDLDYNTLRSIKPDVILVRMAAYGHSGPYEHYPGIGGTIEPMSGMSYLHGYEDGPPMNSGQMYPDPVAATYAASACLLALRHRDRTGEGQVVDLSMQEANMTMIGDVYLDYAATGRVRGRLGNRHLTLAPHNIYACRPATGGERWIAIAARDEVEWQALCRLAGHPEWESDERFLDNGGRKRNEAALDVLISAWTRDQDADELEERLGRSLPAARVRTGVEIRDVPQQVERGFFARLTHPETGPLDYAGVPFRMSVSQPEIVRPAPLLGEHSWEVLREYLDMDEAEYESLVADGVTGMGAPPGWDGKP
jgi:crotonobetainyl-CoA:carnitine CoA-transferase CaiB-like acyl-CoA transferase